MNEVEQRISLWKFFSNIKHRTSISLKNYLHLEDCGLKFFSFFEGKVETNPILFYIEQTRKISKRNKHESRKTFSTEY